MKKTNCLFIIIAMMFIAAPCWADRSGYTIGEYAFSGEYTQNNMVIAQESIEVNFEEPRHGIYRIIPEYFYMKTPDGNVRKYCTEIMNASVENYDYTLSSSDDNFQFKIGSGDYEVEGRQVYNLSYNYSIPEDRYKNADFIFYSVLGADWATTIKHFTFDLTFENGVPDNFKVYSGKLGNEDQAFEVKITKTENGIHGEAFDIQPYNAITLFAEVEEGYFSNVRKANNPRGEWVAYFLALIVCLVFNIKIFSTKQRTPVQTVEFYPPEGITSAEVGTIIDNSADEIDIISLIPYLAQKGYISIEEKTKGKKDKVLIATKIKDLPDDSPDYLKTFFNGLFSKKTTVHFDDLPGEFVDKFMESKTSLKKAFSGNKKLYLFENSDFKALLITTLLTGFTFMNNTQVEFLGNYMSIIGILILFFTGIGISTLSYQKSFYKRKHQRKTFVGLIIIAAELMYFIPKTIANDSLINGALTGLLLVLYGLVCVFANRMVIPTNWNIEVTGKLMGLKAFIQSAELPRLKVLVDENPEYFYNVLPYAMVFNLTDKWADAFKDIELKQPDWYRCSNFKTFNPTFLTTSISDGISSSISKELSKSTASHSSGGGFSGGGGGGGGGGSW